jgi:hypothetical protein
MQSNNKRVRYEYLVMIGLLIFFIVLIIQNHNEDNDLKINGKIVHAKIVNYLGSSKGAGGRKPSFKCEFEFNGEKKILISSSSILSNGISYVGKTYPALYSAKTNSLRLLITEQDYRMYNQQYLDSVTKSILPD